MRLASITVDPDDGHPAHVLSPAGRGPHAGRTRSSRQLRRGYQVPVVRELPRRWDALTDAEVVVREAA